LPEKSARRSPLRQAVFAAPSVLREGREFAKESRSLDWDRACFQRFRRGKRFGVKLAGRVRMRMNKMDRMLVVVLDDGELDRMQDRFPSPSKRRDHLAVDGCMR